MVCVKINPPNNPEDEYYQCCCGCHVHTYVLILSILELITAILATILVVALGAYPVVLLTLFSAGVYTLMVCGHRKLIWWMYLPDLFHSIGRTISAFFYSAYAIILGLTKDNSVPGIDLSFVSFCLIASFAFAYIAGVKIRALQYAWKFGGRHRTSEEQNGIVIGDMHTDRTSEEQNGVVIGDMHTDRTAC